MSKPGVDSDLYGDIYADEDNEYVVTTTEEQELEEEIDIITEPVEQASSSSVKKEPGSSSMSLHDAHRFLPAKPNVSSQTALSYSAQVAKQFSAYQQTPSQERQQRTEIPLPPNPRIHSARPTMFTGSIDKSTLSGTSDGTVFGKKPSEMHDAGKMFIGGLNWDTTDEGLRDYFSQFGKVDACTIMRDQSGTSRGFAFLTFEDPASVNAVVAREHTLDGKAIDPKRAIPREEHLRNTRYFVGGLSPTTTSESMRQFFAAYGKVVDATVMLDRESGRSKGFGFVTFEDACNADQIIGKIGLVLDDKQIEVKAAQPRSQRDQPNRTSNSGSQAPNSLENFDQRIPSSTMNFAPQNQQNPMSMLYQHSMAQMPLAMMGMNPMMGMGMGGFNMANNVPTMNLMGGGFDGMGHLNGMGNMGPMRLGVGPVGNMGMGTPAMLRGSGPQMANLRSGGMGTLQSLSNPANLGRMMGGSGIGPSRASNRGQHGFHPYAR